MKLNKKQAGLIAGVVCVILLLLLLLSMCNSGGQNESAQPVETTEPTVSATEETTESTEETTEATEETTEATEETTEPTEEATEPTTGSGGNTSPGGTTGYYPNTGGNNDNNNTGNQGTVEETIPAAGSEGSPYTEMIASLPDGFRTVTIPSDSPVFHNLYIESAAVLTIQDADAYVVYDGTKYEADAEGIVSVTLGAPEADSPVSIQIGNKNGEEKAFDLAFGPILGSGQNPEIIYDAQSIEDAKWTAVYDTKLEAGNKDGYWYQYTATEKGTLVLQPEGITENIGYDIIVTVTEDTAKLSESQDGTASAEVKAGDVVMIQVVAIPAEDGTYPALDVAVRCTMQYAPGTIHNPVSANDVKSIGIGPLEPGEEIYYYADNISGAKLLISDANAYIRIGEEKHIAENGRVLVTISTEDRVAFSVGNDGESTAAYTLNINYPLGTKLNPVRLTINRAVSISAQQDYYYTWTATGAGKLTVTINPQNSMDWSFAVSNVTTGEYGDIHSSTDDPVVETDAIGFSKGDIIQLVVKGKVQFTTKAGKKDASAVSDTELQLGENELKTVSSATTTVYKFAPAEIGTYTFETTAGTLSYWGSSLEEMANATAEESAQLTQSVTTEGAYVLVGVTGAGSCTLTITKTVDYGAAETPVAYVVTLSETQEIVYMDLSVSHELYLNEEDGYYYLSENGPLVLVDFSSNTFVNLAKLLETTGLYCEITVEDGSVIRETYNTLLQKYISGAQVIEVSAEETRTLYPLTEDLMYILKQAGQQLGWYDSANGAYLFKEVAEAQKDSLWMFPCCYVQTKETQSVAQEISQERSDVTEQPADVQETILEESK